MNRARYGYKIRNIVKRENVIIHVRGLNQTAVVRLLMNPIWATRCPSILEAGRIGFAFGEEERAHNGGGMPFFMGTKLPLLSGCGVE